MQDTVGVDLAIGYHVGGPGEGIDGQQCKCGGGGDELGIGGWGKEAALVQPVERLSVEGGYADAELSVAQCWVGEDGVDAVGQSLQGLSGLRWGIAGGLRWRLGW